MEQNLIKNYADIESNSPEDLISVNIIIEIQMGEGKEILESIKINFNENITIKEMLKEIIPALNDSLQSNNQKVYLNPESYGYQLCECHENSDGGIIIYSNGNIIEKKEKLKNISARNFKVLYSSKDIILNFQPKKTVCDLCLII